VKNDILSFYKKDLLGNTMIRRFMQATTNFTLTDFDDLFNSTTRQRPKEKNTRINIAMKMKVSNIFPFF
jgi:hypothetical protein